MPILDEATLLSTKEAARRLGCTPQHLRLLFRTRRLNAIRVGKVWAVKEQDLRDFQASRMMKHLRFTNSRPKAEAESRRS
jgi:excisionase family DNA binding protein